MEAAVYILTNAGNNVLYIGSTSKGLKARIWEHKEKLVKSFTAKYDVLKLVYYEACEDRDQAVKREHQLKNWHRQWKINLIEQFNPSWKDLYPDLE